MKGTISISCQGEQYLEEACHIPAIVQHAIDFLKV